MSLITVEPAELAEARAVRQAFIDLTHRLGRVEFAKHAADRERQVVLTEFDALEQRERTHLDALITKYGTGTLNIETGTFTPSVSV